MSKRRSEQLLKRLTMSTTAQWMSGELPQLPAGGGGPLVVEDTRAKQAAAPGPPPLHPPQPPSDSISFQPTRSFLLLKPSVNSSHVKMEIGTIIYSLGCFPSQKDLHDFIAEVEEDHTGCIHLDKFLPAMTKVLLEHKFPPIPEDLLLQAFEVLDKEKKGYLEPEELTKYMTTEGEPFTQVEMDEMLTALADQEKNCIYYKDLISQLTIDPDL